VVVDPLVPV